MQKKKIFSVEEFVNYEKFNFVVDSYILNLFVIIMLYSVVDMTVDFHDIS